MPSNRKYHQIYFRVTLSSKGIIAYLTSRFGFPGGSDGKESACNVEDLGSIPGQKDPLEKGTATHCSILAWRLPMDRETIVHGVAKSGHD